MRNVFVDSSEWIAFFSASDGNHRRAEAALRREVGEGRRLVTSNLVLAEVHRLFVHRAGTLIARTVLDRILRADEIAVVHAEPRHHDGALRFLERLSDQPLTYADAVSFAIMKTERCRIALTFDRHFRMAGFDVRP